MNKAELVEFIATDMEIAKVQAAGMLDSFLSAVQKNLKEEVKISGFGSFSARKRNARTGRNPQTGESIKIPSRWVPVFKAGSSLKEAAGKKVKV